jgi:hypothetical protein
LEGFELRADELIILEHAARLQDQIPGLEAGEDWSQVRLHRMSVARLLQQLGLGEAVSGTARSDLGRRLARARWG